jgi:fumarylacetoacetate (FAA) hydrolase
MKLATLKDGTRDGRLVVVSRDLSRACGAQDIAPTLQRALDEWDRCAPALETLSSALNRGEAAGTFPFDPRQAAAPLPRAYQFADGSGYMHHGKLMMRAFDTENKIDFPQNEPLVYQGCSDTLIGPCDDIEVADESWGIDFEGELAVITGDVPMRISPRDAQSSIRLVMICNDVSLRNLIMPELAKGFGFVQSKPASSFSPVAATPDELGPAWRDGRVHLPLRIDVNGTQFGKVNAGIGASFSFPDFIAHVARTRRLCAGSIVGGGTISNAEPGVGSSCIAERRAIERIESGAPKTEFLQFGDRVRLEVFDAGGHSVFGAIDQVIARFKGG